MHARLLLLGISPALIVGVLAASCGTSGCGTETINFSELGRDCTLEEARLGGCFVCPKTCALLDGGVDAADDALLRADAGTACEGECVPNHGVNWLGPVLVWMGPKDEAPACPEQAKTTEDWHADLVVPPASCGECSCHPPVGSCALPTQLTASTATCAGSQSGVWFSPFDAPSGWDGACTSMNPIPAGCNGGLCTKSVTVAPLTVKETDCATAMVGPVEPWAAPTWSTFARTCSGTLLGGGEGCTDSGHKCAPTTAPGFSQCTYRAGDFPCESSSPYLVRHVLYESYADARGCAPCTCGEVVGSSCLAKVSVFTDPSCSVLLETHTIDSSVSSCFDVLPAGSALGSKAATVPTYKPGACEASGGELTGAAEPLFPTTFCCLSL